MVKQTTIASMSDNRNETRLQTRPPSSLAQVILLLLMTGILLGFWREDLNDDLSAFEIRSSRSDHPLLLKLDGVRLQVINADDGQTIFAARVDLDRTSKGHPVARKWFDWPSRYRQQNRLTPLEYSPPSAWLHCNDTVAVVSQMDYEDRVVDRYADRYTIFDLPTGKSFFWIDERTNQSTTLSFERVDSFICAIRFAYVDGFPPTKAEAMQNPARFAKFVVAFDLADVGREITDEQKHKSISLCALEHAFDHSPQRKKPRDIAVLQHLHQWNRDGITIKREQTSEHLGSDRLSIDTTIRVMDAELTSIWDRSWHWIVNMREQRARPIAWPFGVGSTFRVETGPDNLQALVGVWNVPSNTSFSTTERRVFWNLEAESVYVLPNAEVHEVEVFGSRALCTTQRGAYWLDLQSGGIQWIRGTGPSRRMTQTLLQLGIVVLWCILWLHLVKPLQKGDQTRRFGLLFTILILGALTIRHTYGFGFRQDWLLAEWLSSITFFVPLLGLLLAATFRQTVSVMVLGASWTLFLLLLASVLRFGATMTYDSLSISAQADVSLREQVWHRLIQRDALRYFPHEPGQRPSFYDSIEKELQFVSDSTAPDSKPTN